MVHPLRCPASLPLAQMLDSSHAHFLRTANMGASDLLQQAAGAMQLLELLNETRRQCAERLQRQGRVTGGGDQSSSSSRAQSGRDSPRTPIPRNDSSSTVGGGSAASSPGQSAAAPAADELLVAHPGIDIAMQSATGLTACSQSQTEEGEPLSESAPQTEPVTESATVSSRALAEHPSGPKSSGVDATLCTPPPTAAIAATSNLRPPDTLLVSPGEVVTATAMDESKDDEPSINTSIAAAPATDLTRDSSDDSCVSVPGSWTAAATGSDGLVGVRLHRREAEQQEQPAGLFPRFDSSPAPAVPRSSITSSANPLLEQLKAWLAALAVGPVVSSPPNLERAPSELAELLSKLAVARQRTGELAQESGNASADSNGGDSDDVASAEEELQWLDELIAVVKRSISVEAATEADSQRPRPYGSAPSRAQSPLPLVPRVDSSAVWRLEQEFGSNATLQDLLSAVSPSPQASSGEPLTSPAPQSFWRTLPDLPEQDSYVFGSPPPSFTLASPWQPRATVIRHRFQSYRDAVTQTELTGSWLDYCAEECRKAVYRAEATADTAAPAAAAAAPASSPPMGLACTHSLRSKQVGAAAAAVAETSPVALSGQVTPAARPAQQDSATLHDGDAQPERTAAAASTATKAAKARLTRSQSGVATLPTPPARETSGTKRGRLESSESLHARITLKDQLTGAMAAAAGSAAAAADAPPAESPLALTSPAKRRKSIPTAAQQAKPAASPTLVASVAPKQKKAAPKATKFNAKAKASAPSDSEGNAPLAAASEPASPAKAATLKSRATSDQNALADTKPPISAAEFADLKPPTPEESAVVEASKAKAEETKQAAAPSIASSPSKNKAKGRKDLLRVGGAKKTKYEAAEPPNAAKDASMQVDSGAAVVTDQEPEAAAAAGASTASAADAAAGAHSSTLSSSLVASNPSKPTKGEQKLAREAETATNAQKLWDIVRSQNLPNTVSPAELRELMGWSPQKIASGINNILRHWATDGRGPPTPEWKNYNRPRKGASPSKATASKIKSDAAPSAAAANARAKSDGSKGKNKFEEMCAELTRSADPGAEATLESSLQPEQLLAAVRAEIALEDAGAETAVENMQLSESMSDAGPSSQSASPLQGSTVSTVSTVSPVSSHMLLTASLSSDAPSAPSDADADVQMQAAVEDEAPPAPDLPSPTPSSSIEPTHLAMHTRIDKR